MIHYYNTVIDAILKQQTIVMILHIIYMPAQ